MTPAKSSAPTLYFAIQTRLHRDSAGRFRASHGYAAYEAWAQYLGAVAEMVLLARVGPEVSDEGVLVEGAGVRVLPAPHYRGLWEFLITLPRTLAFVNGAVRDATAVYGARVPDVFGSIVHRRTRRIGARFFVQVVGDRSEVLRAGSLGRVGKLFWRLSRERTAAQVRKADGVIYVTENALQQRYPASPQVPTTIRSNVILDEASFADRPRDYGSESIRGLTIVTAGSQERDYKGHDVLIEAIAVLKARAVSVRAIIIGDGLLNGSLRQLAGALGVSGDVTFAGQLPSAAHVRSVLRDADVFVLPSRTEGLSRVLIEAMATGLFCIGTEVGGTPELLPPEQLVPPDDAEALASAIESFMTRPDEMTLAAASGLDKARTIARDRSGRAVLQEFLQRLVED